ncbi:hypothetical protein N480_07885 [Pseudoalteromonas luteoviolacea S2607]|nr:hypothetical protein N480_07885 [Pseudoalteromonas luteoviolacea S2607]
MEFTNYGNEKYAWSLKKVVKTWRQSESNALTLSV